MQKIYGLLGRTLVHSYSADIHHLLGNDAYALYELEPQDLSAFFAQENFGGVNVTIPYKKDVLKYCDVLAPEVEEIGAANVILKKDGKFIAHNTDKAGFLYMLNGSSISVQGKKVLVLGSGGASASVQVALKDLNPKEVVVISRSGENNYDNLGKHADADVIINTTPVGMYPDVTVSPVELDMFPHLSGVLDLIYNPLRTDIMLQAETRGIPAVGGMSMLVAQAVATHELFFDTRVKEKAFQDVLSTLTHRAQNIVLCGMPGTGKTSVAKAIGNLTGRDVIDTDELAEQLAGKSISRIFAEDGETFFRVYEHQAIEQACKYTGIVISLGGGAVVNDANYKPVKRNGRIYCLHRNLDLLPLDNRPLSKDRDTLKQMEQDRAPLYARFADVSLENNGTLEQIVQAVLDDFAGQ